jgi:hypothetical protein
MNARKIEVHIGALVLRGFDRRDRWWIHAGNIPTTTLAEPANAEAEIADAAHRGGVK